MHTEWSDDLRKALKRPFPESAVKWRASAVSQDGTRAQAVAYIDARNVMERLDRTVGPGGWSDSFRPVTVGGEDTLECTLTVLGVSKADVGEPPKKDSFASAAKTLYSDALKRAGVKFGIGRYLYALPSPWVNYDKQRQRLLERPELPEWARPQHIGEKETEDPGESLPDPEPEHPLVTREDAVKAGGQKPPAGKPGLYVLQYGRKHKGKTLTQIEGEDPGYLTKLIEESSAGDDVKAAVQAFLNLLEKNGDKSQLPASKGGPGWPEDEKQRAIWFAFLNRKEISPNKGKTALGVESLKDYKGTIGEAMTAVVAA